MKEKKMIDEPALLQNRLHITGAMMAGVAHEINNPLSWILSNLNYLKNQCNKLKKQATQSTQDFSDLENIVMESIQGVERIRDIVRVFKNVRSLNEASQSEINIHGVLDSVIEMSLLECKYRAKIEKNFSPDIPLIIANSGQLHQVFFNLLITAAQAIPEGDVEHNIIAIKTRLESEMIRIDIKDTGQGIDPENLPHIFEPFFSTKPVGVGTGLGLAICSEIISNLGGKIDVKSQLGQGSTISVYLPT